MDKKQAMEVVAQALALANKAGVYELQDSATIFNALGVIAKELGLAQAPAPAEGPAEEPEPEAEVAEPKNKE